VRLRLLAVTAAALAAGLVLLALGWAMLGAQRAAGTPLLGRAAPNLVVRTFEGDQISLEAMRGRPLVVNFWASWCGPCRQEAGVLRDAARAHTGQVAFLGVNVHDSQAAARSFVTETGPAYPVGEIVAGSTGAYGLGDALPETFFIDSRGVVVAHVRGPLSNVALEGYLRQLS
jgi:cytochrome c biogenesis protein CcmG, thiol:disulfide interchange protein DsbE